VTYFAEPQNHWLNTDNMKAADGVFSSYADDHNQSSALIKASNFDFSSVPDGATILGIVARVSRYTVTADTTGDITVKLSKNGSTFPGDNLASAAHWPTSNSSIDYGGSTNLWGMTLSSADVKSANFTLGFVANHLAGNSDCFIDYIQVGVYYDPP